MQENKLDISVRLGQVLKSLGVSQTEFAKTLGYPKPNVVHDTLTGKAKPSFDFWERFFNSEYSEMIDGAWFITGKGSMLKTLPGFIVTKEGGTVNEPATEYKGKQKLIPYYDVDFEAGFSVVENNQQVNPDALISDPLFAGSDFVVRLHGDSMSKRIPAGSYLGVKRVEFIDVEYGETYGLVTKSHRTVKNVRKSKLKNHVLLVPENTENFDARDYPIDRVLSWWLVVAHGTKCVGM